MLQGFVSAVGIGDLKRFIYHSDEGNLRVDLFLIEKTSVSENFR